MPRIAKTGNSTHRGEPLTWLKALLGLDANQIARTIVPDTKWAVVSDLLLRKPPLKTACLCKAFILVLGIYWAIISTICSTIKKVQSAPSNEQKETKPVQEAKCLAGNQLQMQMTMGSQVLVDDDRSEHNGTTNDITSIPPLFSTEVMTRNGIAAAGSARQQEIHSSKVSSIVDHLSRHYSNPSLQVDSSHNIFVSDTPIQCPGPTEALIHIRCSGICGSDLHLWHRGRIGTLVINRPCILGHEAAGEVLAVGAKVTNLKPTDRVAIEPGVPCHKCFLCRSGRYNLCERVRFCGVGTPGCGGSIRRFMCHDARYCHVMPKSMSWSQGALLEPLGVVMHAISECRGGVALGKPALICGAGPIGLIALKAARASGAWPLVITDIDSGRLKFAEMLVPGVKTWRVDAGLSEAQNAEAVRNLFGCKGDRDLEHGLPDEEEYVAPGVVLECTGIESSVVTAAYACRRGGMVMVIGVGRDKMNNLPFMHMSLAEIQLKFINRYRDTWPAAINLLTDQRVLDLDQLVTHIFELVRSVEAMETCADRSLGSIKVHIVDNTQIEIDI